MLLKSGAKFGIRLPMVERMPQGDWQFSRAMLPAVSRTFALNIKVLSGELYQSVLLAYLLCRILDTVEDAPELDAPTKKRLLDQMADLIRQRYRDEAALEKWTNEVAAVDGRDQDLVLLRGTPRVIRCIKALSDPMQDAIYPSAIAMAVGMGDYAIRQADSLTFLEDEKDLEDYCYIVAGTVGEMLCALFKAAHPDIPGHAFAVMQKNAVSFGLGLQITNITKDFVQDSKRGYCFVPQTYVDRAGIGKDEWPNHLEPDGVASLVQQLATKAMQHLDDAFSYTLAIPRQYWRLRLFCLWPLWMAVASLNAVVKNSDALAEGVAVKIGRSQVRRILGGTSLRAWSNHMLKREFDQMRQQLLSMIDATAA